MAGSIFYVSTDAGSSESTSRFTRPILLWLMPGISEDSIGVAQLIVRKSAHGAEYALLAALIWRALYRPRRSHLRPWSMACAFQAWLGASAYAVTDEFHQTFVPSRQASPWDVLVDAFGAVLGLTIVYGLGKWRSLWR